MEVYIYCPSKFATGGTELLHQLHYKLRIKGINSFIYYFDNVEEDLNNSIADRFKKYIKEKTEIVSEINDVKTNIIILPEVYFVNTKFKEIKKIHWWLSVDNFFVVNNIEKKDLLEKSFLKKFLVKKSPKIEYINWKLKNNDVILNLCQSHYAINFCKHIGVRNVLKLSDYLNKDFFEEDISEMKEDIIIYNPKKGFEYINEIRKLKKFSNLKWIAIENMSPLEVKNLMHRAKVYIDFGEHPGKDRIPREAVCCNCCIITNLRGSAENDFDIPINSLYKFLNPLDDKERLLNLIVDIFNNYDYHLSNFNNYKDSIKNEEVVFDSELDFIIQKINA